MQTYTEYLISTIVDKCKQLEVGGLGPAVSFAHEVTYRHVTGMSQHELLALLVTNPSLLNLPPPVASARVSGWGDPPLWQAIDDYLITAFADSARKRLASGPQ